MAFVNHYYLLRLLAEQGEDYPVAQSFFGNGDPGSLVNVAGVGQVASTNQPEASLAFIEYLLSNQRLQDPQLRKLEVLEVTSLGEDRAEVGTREFWLTRILSIDGTPGIDADRWQILFGRYLVARTTTGWEVQAWEFAEPSQPADQVGAAEETSTG